MSAPHWRMRRMICSRTCSEGSELAIVVVESLVLRDAQPPACLLRLRAPAHGQGSATLTLVAGVPVGDRDELHEVAAGGPEGGRAAHSDVTVVGMRPEGNDPELPARARLGRRSERQGRGGQGQNTNDHPFRSHVSLLSRGVGTPSLRPRESMASGTLLHGPRVHAERSGTISRLSPKTSYDQPFQASG